MQKIELGVKIGKFSSYIPDNIRRITSLKSMQFLRNFILTYNLEVFDFQIRSPIYHVHDGWLNDRYILLKITHLKPN